MTLNLKTGELERLSHAKLRTLPAGTRIVWDYNEYVRTDHAYALFGRIDGRNAVHFFHVRTGRLVPVSHLGDNGFAVCRRITAKEEA